MAFNNGSIIYLADLIRNKSAEGEDMTDAEWSALITANSQRYFANLLGIPNLYQVGIPIERRGAELSRVISQKLRPFYVRETANVVGGVVSLTGRDLAYFLAIEPSSISGRGFDELEPSEVADRLGDPVVAPTEDDPCYEFSNANSILIYPNTLSTVVLKYYKYPTDAVVVRDTNPTTLLLTYNTGSSTETGWNKNELVDIAYLCLRDLGLAMERQDIQAYADKMVTNG